MAITASISKAVSAARHRLAFRRRSQTGRGSMGKMTGSMSRELPNSTHSATIGNHSIDPERRQHSRISSSTLPTMLPRDTAHLYGSHSGLRASRKGSRVRDAAIITDAAAMGRNHRSWLAIAAMPKPKRTPPKIMHIKMQNPRVRRWYFSAMRSAARFWVSTLAVSSSCSVTSSAAQMSSSKVMSG